MIDRLTEVIATCDNESIYGTASALLKIRDGLEKSGEIKNPDALDYFAKTRLESLILTKLGKYEDVEQELGIDLVTFVKLNKTDKIYDKEEETFMFFNWIDLKNKCLVCEDDFDEMSGGYLHTYYYFKDYGKTWALTKEELEK